MAKWIIVVDDDTANLKMAGHILSKNNMRVTALKSGSAFLDYVNDNGMPDLVLLDFAGSGNDFEVSEEEINIGVSVQKGNTTLKDAIDAYLKGKNADDFNALMEKAIKIQPLSE